MENVERWWRVTGHDESGEGWFSDYWTAEEEAARRLSRESGNSVVEYVPLSQLQGAVAALRKIAELDDEGGKHVEVCLVAARAIAADELARLGGR